MVRIASNAQQEDAQSVRQTTLLEMENASNVCLCLAVLMILLALMDVVIAMTAITWMADSVYHAAQRFQAVSNVGQLINAFSALVIF